MYTEAKVSKGTCKENFKRHLVGKKDGILSNRKETGAADALGIKRGTPVVELCIEFSWQGFHGKGLYKKTPGAVPTSESQFQVAPREIQCQHRGSVAICVGPWWIRYPASSPWRIPC